MTAKECRQKLTAERYALARELWKHPDDRDAARIASLKDSAEKLSDELERLEDLR